MRRRISFKKFRNQKRRSNQKRNKFFSLYRRYKEDYIPYIKRNANKYRKRKIAIIINKTKKEKQENQPKVKKENVDKAENNDIEMLIEKVQNIEL